MNILTLATAHAKAHNTRVDMVGDGWATFTDGTMVDFADDLAMLAAA